MRFVLGLYRRHGEYIAGATLKVPKLKVEREWYKGLPNEKDAEVYIDLSAQRTEGEAANQQYDPQFQKSKKPKIMQHKSQTVQEEEANGKDVESAKQVRHVQSVFSSIGTNTKDVVFMPSDLEKL